MSNKRRPSSGFTVKINGSFMGVRANVSSNQFRNGWRQVQRKLPLSRDKLLSELRPIFKRRFERRIPALKRGLGYGIRDAMGTRRFEGTSHGTHQPHRDIRNPLTLIVDQGMTYKVAAFKQHISIELKVHNTRRAGINFHNSMKKVPRISTVWNRLDATCLPYVKEGHRDKVIQRWLEYTKIGLGQDLKNYFEVKKAMAGD